MAYTFFFLLAVKDFQNNELLLEKLQVKIDVICLGSKKSSLFFLTRKIFSVKSYSVQLILLLC